MIRKLFRKLLFAVYLVIAVSALLEIGVRLSGYSEHHICDPIYMPFDGASEIPYVHKPHLANARARGLAMINTDSLGLRSKTGEDRFGPRQRNEFIITIVGDSVTFGEGIKETADTFAQVLEDTLNQKQSTFQVRVFNYAASAYSVKVMTATLQYRMLEVQPDLVIMAIVPTDFNPDRTPSVDKWGYLTDNKMSAFLPRDSRIRLSLRRIHFLYFLRDTIYPLLDGSRKAEDILASGGLPESYADVKQFASIAAQQKLAYSIVLLPSLKHQYGILPARLQQDGVSFADFSGLRAEFSESEFKSTRFDSHPSSAVHRRIAESLVAYVLENFLLTKK
jgi:hypothetical protein